MDYLRRMAERTTIFVFRGGRRWARVVSAAVVAILIAYATLRLSGWPWLACLAVIPVGYAAAITAINAAFLIGLNAKVRARNSE